MAATGGVGPAGPIRRVRASLSGSPRAVAWALPPLRGPDDAFEIPYHSDLTCPGHPGQSSTGRPGQWRGPSGAPAYVTRLPLRTGSTAREGEAQCSRPDVDSLGYKIDNLFPRVRSSSCDWRRRISQRDPQMLRLPELHSVDDRPTSRRARVPGSTVTEKLTGASPAPVSY